ncbi:hypothetical protein HN51_036605 [Arachis hypogaea]|nr:Aspartate--tRNA ligase 2, cytoplasmic [Arachis hypogaea]
MPCYSNPQYSNSFDVFIRDEEIISGTQCVHDPEMLEKWAESCGINVKTISTYFDSFKHFSWPLSRFLFAIFSDSLRNSDLVHQHTMAFGDGLEPVVMLFCGLNNVRRV